MSKAYLLLGSNLGNREENLQTAIRELETLVGCITKYSSIYETAAWGVEDQPSFLNQVIEVDTALSPEQVLENALAIEAVLGRKRWHKWHARTMDIDILYYDNLVIRTANLIVPHKEIQNRMFTLVPLAEIAPDFIHPKIGKSNLELLENCDDELGVEDVKNSKANIR